MVKKFLCLILLVSSLFLYGCKSTRKTTRGQNNPVTIKIGHVGHDHHLGLFTAFDNAPSYADATGITLKEVEKHHLYEMYRDNSKVADIEIVKVGGGSKMPTAIAQGLIEIGFGGVAPVFAAVDSGAPIRLISPLHYKGDMFVVRPDFPAKTWQQFVEKAKAADKPIRIGYKSPMAVAKMIFEEALTHEGITFSSNTSKADVNVHMINVKGGGKLNVALASGLIDGYSGNNPFCAIAVEKKAGRIICDLEELPPGTFRNHPCCCIAAGTDAIEEKGEIISEILGLFIMGTETINSDPDSAVASACSWIGTSESVERMSIPTSGYSMEENGIWHETMSRWITAMNSLGVFKDKLIDVEYTKAETIAYDLTLLKKAREKLAKHVTKK